MEIKKITLTKILENITSGRFILTMTGAVSFFFIVRCMCAMLLEKSNEIDLSDLMSILSPVLIILSNIFTFYFVKSNLQSGSVNDSNGDNINGRDNGSSTSQTSSSK